MKLIKNGTVVDPDWIYRDRAEDIDQNTNQIVPLELFVELFLKNPDLSVGIQINVDTNLEDVAPHLKNVSLVVIEFASYADGRGFSIAHRLRHSLGYTGKIWGSGSLIADQYALAVQCGIDAILVDKHLLKRQPIEHWQEALTSAPTPYRYQESMVQDASVSSPASNRVVGVETISSLNARFDGLATSDLLAFALHDESMGKSTVVSSFGAESVVLLHLIAKISPHSPILFLDTRKLFPETLEYQKELVERLQLTNVEILRPNATAIERSDPHGTLWQQDNAACCDLRKVDPLKAALVGYDTWISGRKSYQSELRSPLQLFERSGNQVKINPLANWSRDQLVEYMQRHELPPHPLVSQGYASIGCAPCTTRVCQGEHSHAGRWRGQDKTECGIHLANGKVVRTQQASI